MTQSTDSRSLDLELPADSLTQHFTVGDLGAPVRVLAILTGGSQASTLVRWAHRLAQAGDGRFSCVREQADEGEDEELVQALDLARQLGGEHLHLLPNTGGPSAVRQLVHRLGITHVIIGLTPGRRGAPLVPEGFTAMGDDVQLIVVSDRRYYPAAPMVAYVDSSPRRRHLLDRLHALIRRT